MSKRSTFAPLRSDAYNVGIRFTDGELDQLSAILSDYITFAHAHCVMLDRSKCKAALDLTEKWISQAADLREKIDGRD